jgi:hypothetical protein
LRIFWTKPTAFCGAGVTDTLALTPVSGSRVIIFLRCFSKRDLETRTGNCPKIVLSLFIPELVPKLTECWDKLYIHFLR